MVEAILRDENRLLPCSVYLDGEYGQKDVVLGVPVKLGREGVAGIVQIKLSDGEKAALQKSADVVRENVKALKL